MRGSLFAFLGGACIKTLQRIPHVLFSESTYL